jgi:hypothetical protein
MGWIIGGVKGHYNRLDSLNEKAAAYRVLEAKLTSIVNGTAPEADKVIELRRKVVA